MAEVSQVGLFLACFPGIPDGINIKLHYSAPKLHYFLTFLDYSGAIWCLSRNDAQYMSTAIGIYVERQLLTVERYLEGLLHFSLIATERESLRSVYAESLGEILLTSCTWDDALNTSPALTNRKVQRYVNKEKAVT